MPTAAATVPRFPFEVVSSARSVTLERSAFVQPPKKFWKSAVEMATTRQSATVVVAPGMEKVVFEVLSVPVEMTFHGSPVVMQPLNAMMSPI